MDIQKNGGVEKIGEFITAVKDKNSNVRLMGFGHRVYKNYDPRAKLMRETFYEVLGELGLQNDPLFKLAMELEKIALHVKLGKIRTITGHKPRLVNLFHRSADADLRPGRHAEAFLIQYDGGDEGPTFTGPAIPPDGRTVYDRGRPPVLSFIVSPKA